MAWARLVNILKVQGFESPVVHSTEQLMYLQKQVAEILGNPNLSDRWWGT